MPWDLVVEACAVVTVEAVYYWGGGARGVELAEVAFLTPDEVGVCGDC